MAVTYVLRFDDNYAVESLKKHNARAKSRWLRWPLKTVCALGMLALIALGVAVKSYVIVAFAATMLALLAAGPRLDYFFVRRRYRKHAQYGLDVTVDLSEESARFTSRDSNSELRWASFVSTLEFSDGLMLYLAPWHYVWLPDSDIRAGDSHEARALVKSKIAKHHGV